MPFGCAPYYGISKKARRRMQCKAGQAAKAAKRAAKQVAADLLNAPAVPLADLYSDADNREVDPSRSASKHLVNTRGCEHLRRIIFVTGNASKLEEFRLIMGEDFHIPIKICYMNLPELQGASAEHVARNKVREACRVLQSKPDEAVICEDTSLCCNALNGLPGPYVKWFLNSSGPHALYKMVEGFKDQSAYAQSIFGFHGPPPLVRGKIQSMYTLGPPTTTPDCCDACRKRDFNDADRDIRVFIGRCDGKIVEPRGEHVFGWDSCFEPTTEIDNDATNRKTFAEMTVEEKSGCSHRVRALVQLKKFLEEKYCVKRPRGNLTKTTDIDVD